MSLPSFRFTSAADIRFGRGAALQAVPDLAQLGARVLLVHGATAQRVRWLEQALTAAGCDVSGYAIPGEPDIAMITSGVAAGRDRRAQAVIACGGGAVIDAGKAIAALVPARRPMLDHLEVVGQGLPLEADPLPFAAIPTTSGTGAEVTRNAVIAVPDARRKVSLRDVRMLARLAIIDPSLTDGCPRSITLASGLDALTQVIEPYLCTGANPMTDALCLSAIESGMRGLVTLMTREDADARDAMAWTSLCGGLTLANAGLGVVHGLAGPLGGLSGAAHGAICGALLPHGLAANADHAAGETRHRIAQVCDSLARVLSTQPEHALAALEAWARDAGLPGLEAQGVSEAHRRDAATMAASSSSMKANPVSLDEAVLRDIMERAR